MIPLFCQWLDRIAINYAAANMPKPDGRDLHLEEARALLQSPDFFPTEPRPATIEFTGGTSFHFPSLRPSGDAVNDIVHGNLYRCDDRWREKPVIILLHGWNDRLDHYYFFPRHARRLNKLGISVMTLQMPWQFDRRPRGLGAWGNFLCADALHTIKGTLQALTDIRAAVNWLAGHSCPFIGLWGVSMGAWFAGLTVCHDPRINCAILTVPIPNLDSIIAEAAFCESIRATLKGQNIDLQKLNLVANSPAIPKENILIVEGEYDLFVRKEIVEDLWHKWGKPEIWRYRQAHISILFAPGFSSRAARWIAVRATAHAAKQTDCRPNSSANASGPHG